MKLEARLALCNLRKLKNHQYSCCRYFHGPPKKEEYSDKPNYPPIRKFKSKDEEKYSGLKSFMKNLQTVEEKQIYLNKPKYYGWYSCVIKNAKIGPTTLEFLQFATNTTIVNDDAPKALKNLDEQAIKEAERLKEPLTKYLLHKESSRLHFQVPGDKVDHHEAKKLEGTHAYQNKLDSDRLNSLHRFLQVHLAPRYSHLRETSVLKNARVDAFWMRGGFDPDMKMVRKRESLRDFRKEKNFPESFQLSEEEDWKKYDFPMQIKNSHDVQVKSLKTFDAFVDIEDELCTKGSVPIWDYNPKYLPFFHKYCQHGTNVPGTWTGSDHLFTSLSYVSSNNEFESSLNQSSAWSDDQEVQNTLTGKALVSSFGLLLPTACYLGFDPFNDPTRPLCTNVIVGDGREFTISSYQLNKTELVDCDEDPQAAIEKYPRNVMWSLPKQTLYEAIDVEAGHVEGLNLEVLAKIIRPYLLKPKIEEKDIDNSEYLAPHKYIQNVKEDYDRRYVYRLHRHLYSNRPRQYAKPDKEPWERINRLKHPEQTFHMGLRELPWYEMAKYDSLGKFHWHPEFRQLDYYIPAYQPSKHRPEGKKKGRGYSRVKQVFPPLPKETE